ncbi:acyltransferase family protein [Arcanobacterium hippocoleae]|uniref:Peptidoglycan/LPS O-acetylase OafA/YrhL n=1 Tax=Arcanobacterium hippocoleae TaxID=149017 RepID=A0ABU1T3L1_9ACTO|nr:acyltransferase family protein [Arcanobacterium hippocoleae]MDR6939953.1 peptidoglycan/LPS O-acetylase OafA/YrhL [Arcanobacterium hippocoleae]
MAQLSEVFTAKSRESGSTNLSNVFTNPLFSTPTAEKSGQKSVARPKIIGLDGLRAIAMIFVVLYHMFPETFAVGFIGVDVFFVISGFLITSLLLREAAIHGKVKICSFWMRRLRRIMPAVIFTTIVTAAFATILAALGPKSSTDATTGLLWQISGAFSGTYNWFTIAHSSSYFDATNPILLTNLWSLAIELQFYIFWPLCLWAIVRFVKDLKTRFGLAAGIAIISAVWYQLLLFFPAANPTRAYVGTDSHLFGLMIGTSLALALPEIMVCPRKTAKTYWGWISLGALLALLILVAFAPDDTWFYPWGMVLAALLTMLIIRGILPDNTAQPSLLIGMILQSTPFTWLGVRSYGIYLWHWPLLVIGIYTLPISRTTLALIVIPLSVLLADISYRFIEQPIRKKTFLGWCKERLAFSHKIFVTISVFATLLTSIAFFGAATASNTTSAQEIVAKGAAHLNAQKSANQDAEKKSPSAPTSQAEQKPATPATPEKPKAKSAPPQHVPTDPPIGELGVQPRVSGNDVTIIGDSVTLASAPAILAQFPGAQIDASVSRSAAVAPKILRNLKAAGNLRKYVVISLATNAIIKPETIDELLQIAGAAHKFVFVTGFAPKYATWVPIANEHIKQAATEHPQEIAVADWAAIAPNHLAEFAGDKIHPGENAARYYANEIARALNSFSSENSH